MSYLYNVMTNRDTLVTVRISENTRDEFKLAAELRGSTMSGLLHQYIVKTIREEKDLSPQLFNKENAEPKVNGSHVKPAEGEIVEPVQEHRSNDRVEPVPDDQVAYVRNLGELTDERKQKPVKKRAGKNK